MFYIRPPVYDIHVHHEHLYMTHVYYVYKFVYRRCVSMQKIILICNKIHTHAIYIYNDVKHMHNTICLLCYYVLQLALGPSQGIPNFSNGHQ